MAGRSEYIISHPNGEDVVRESKGGKVPTYATWALFTEAHPHPTDGAGWVLMGWSYQTNAADANKKALPDFRKNGMQVMATRVLPTRP